MLKPHQFNTNRMLNLYDPISDEDLYILKCKMCERSQYIKEMSSIQIELDNDEYSDDTINIQPIYEEDDLPINFDI